MIEFAQKLEFARRKTIERLEMELEEEEIKAKRQDIQEELKRQRGELLREIKAPEQEHKVKEESTSRFEKTEGPSTAVKLHITVENDDKNEPLKDPLDKGKPEASGTASKAQSWKNRVTSMLFRSPWGKGSTFSTTMVAPINTSIGMRQQIRDLRLEVSSKRRKKSGDSTYDKSTLLEIPCWGFNSSEPFLHEYAWDLQDAFSRQERTATPADVGPDDLHVNDSHDDDEGHGEETDEEMGKASMNSNSAAPKKPSLGNHSPPGRDSEPSKNAPQVASATAPSQLSRMLTPLRPVLVRQKSYASPSRMTHNLNKQYVESMTTSHSSKTSLGPSNELPLIPTNLPIAKPPLQAKDSEEDIGQPAVNAAALGRYSKLPSKLKRSDIFSKLFHLVAGTPNKEQLRKCDTASRQARPTSSIVSSNIRSIRTHRLPKPITPPGMPVLYPFNVIGPPTRDLSEAKREWSGLLSLVPKRHWLGENTSWEGHATNNTRPSSNASGISESDRLSKQGSKAGPRIWIPDLTPAKVNSSYPWAMFLHRKKYDPRDKLDPSSNDIVESTTGTVSLSNIELVHQRGDLETVNIVITKAPSFTANSTVRMDYDAEIELEDSDDMPPTDGSPIYASSNSSHSSDTETSNEVDGNVYQFAKSSSSLRSLNINYSLLYDSPAALAAAAREIPDHLPNSPLCPLNVKYAGGSGKVKVCPTHGRALPVKLLRL